MHLFDVWAGQIWMIPNYDFVQLLLLFYTQTYIINCAVCMLTMLTKASGIVIFGGVQKKLDFAELCVSMR